MQGLPELRKTVASFHRKKDGVDILPENVLIGPGSKELLFLLQLVFEGGASFRVQVGYHICHRPGSLATKFMSFIRWLKNNGDYRLLRWKNSVLNMKGKSRIPFCCCSREIENYLKHARRILSLLGNTTAAILRYGDIHVNDPTGGFYLFLDFSAHKEKLFQRGISDSLMLCEALLSECGVA